MAHVSPLLGSDESLQAPKRNHHNVTAILFAALIAGTGCMMLFMKRSQVSGRGRFEPEVTSAYATLKPGRIAHSRTPSSTRPIVASAATGKSVYSSASDTDATLTSEEKAKVKEMTDDAYKQAREMGFFVRDTGVTGPLGFWDPLGFSTEVSDGKLLFYREVELKHGRVCMLAALGILVGEKWHPLFGGDINVPAYVAFQATPLQTFWPLVIAAIAIPEIAGIKAFDGRLLGKWIMKTDGRLPGDYGFDPLSLKPKDLDELKDLHTREINNGRLAMIATAGMIAQELATGQKLFG